MYATLSSAAAPAPATSMGAPQLVRAYARGSEVRIPQDAAYSRSHRTVSASTGVAVRVLWRGDGISQPRSRSQPSACRLHFRRLGNVRRHDARALRRQLRAGTGTNLGASETQARPAGAIGRVSRREVLHEPHVRDHRCCRAHDRLPDERQAHDRLGRNARGCRRADSRRDSFSALGLFIGAYTSGSAAPAVANLVFLPMTWLSGLFFPLPKFLQSAVVVWPAFHLNQLGMAAANVDQFRFVDPKISATVLVAMTILFGGLALRRLARVG